MVRATYLLPAVLILTGCACQPEQVPIPTPVEVPGPVRYVPIPAELLVCRTDDDRPATNGQLLESWRSRGERLEECRRNLDEAGRLAGK